MKHGDACQVLASPRAARRSSWTSVLNARLAVSRDDLRETAPIRSKKSNDNFHGDTRVFFLLLQGHPSPTSVCVESTTRGVGSSESCAKLVNVALADSGLPGWNAGLPPLSGGFLALLSLSRSSHGSSGIASDSLSLRHLSGTRL